MELGTILLVVPIFLIVFRGVGMLLDTRPGNTAWAGRKRTGSTGKSLRELSTLIGGMGFNQIFLRSKRFREHLELLLLRSGNSWGLKMEDVLFYKEIAVVIAAVLLWQFQTVEILYWVIGLILAFWLPDLALSMEGSNRRTVLQRQLPGFIDLLALAVESGLDLMVAVERIFERMKPNALREELQTMLQETRLGSARKDILQRWAHRIGLADAQSLASLIVQSEEMGTPLAAVLRSYTEDMRTRRILRAEELAGKIPVKILFPMMVFFFPIVFAIILGPVALDFMKNYK